MTQIRHARNAVHNAVDAHGRPIDSALAGMTPTHSCCCTRPVIAPRARGRPGAVAVRVAAVLAAGLVLSVLLVVLRDIVTAVASTSLAGVAVRALLGPWNRRER